MAHHCLSTRLAHQLPAQAGRHDTPLTLDVFVSTVYLPHVKVRKRSWHVDERIARQHLSPVFGDRRLADIQRPEVGDWLRHLSSSGLVPATCNRILAVFKMRWVVKSGHKFMPPRAFSPANTSGQMPLAKGNQALPDAVPDYKIFQYIP